MAGTPSIRDVITFPKTQSGADPLTGAPTPVPPSQLAEVRLRSLDPPGRQTDRG
jgi:aspartyl-tRNA synthetase